MKNSDHNERPGIRELIVVEGVDDISAVKKAVRAEVLAVGGFSVFKGMDLPAIRRAAESQGVIVLTDPDHAGERIRSHLNSKISGLHHAYISRVEGTKADNIGVENASPDSILSALKKAHCREEQETTEYSLEDMLYYDLNGSPDSKRLRRELGQVLRIGYGNARQFLSRLNHYGITRKELEEELKKILSS